jgi:hypothetical protein
MKRFSRALVFAAFAVGFVVLLFGDARGAAAVRRAGIADG